MKYFISQPMRNKTDEEIKSERERVISEIMLADPDAEIIDSFVEGVKADTETNPVWYLGRAIIGLSKADIAVFARGWHTARGCLVEHMICERYGIKRVSEYMIGNPKAVMG